MNGSTVNNAGYIGASTQRVPGIIDSETFYRQNIKNNASNKLGANPKNTGSAEKSIYTSVKPLGDIFPELAAKPNLNPHYVNDAPPGININCVNCVNAATKRLTGEKHDAVAEKATRYVDKNGLLETIPFGYDTSIKTPHRLLNS